MMRIDMKNTKHQQNLRAKAAMTQARLNVAAGFMNSAINGMLAYGDTKNRSPKYLAQKSVEIAGEMLDCYVRLEKGVAE